MKYKEIIALHLRGAKDLSRKCPQLFPAIFVNSIVSAVAPYVTVWFSAQLLGELSGLRRPEVLQKWTILTVLCVGVAALLTALASRWRECVEDDVWFRKEQIFIEKQFSMDYAALDEQDNRDLRAKINEVESWSGWGHMRIPDFVEDTLKSILGILGGIALTVSLFTAKVPETAGSLTILNHPLSVVILLAVMFLFSFLAGFFDGKFGECWNSLGDDATFSNRLFCFFGFIGDHRGRDMDIRMYNQQNLVKKYWSQNTAFSTEGTIGRMARGKLGLYKGLGAAFPSVFTGFVYLFTCLKAWAGAFGIGSVTQYVGAVTALSTHVAKLFEVSGTMKANAVNMERVYEFLDIPNAMYQGSLTTEKRSDRQYEVEFRNVSFRYPGSEKWALKNVSMKFKVGKRLAIVGENGSGKTTFIKLLCRLYDPQEGQILLNGIDIRKYNYRDYMGIFSVVFQDFQLLSQPLGANVAGRTDYDRARAEKALTDAGFGDRLATLPDGLDTQLYKDFAENGVEVSGGEAQKIAIARALYKDAPFIILDEPTAALDPIAEAEIYSKFNDISGDKTAIYISHRLSSCKFCDEIAVFDNGAVIQKGTHEALLADEGGKYHALWHAQAQYYTEA
ncbi:MAG: ABC transporter ATP-binding protein [Eubacteriales bacterium]|nr:ABC transporter ATP-binding protein [Eubacteriales bacterium]